MRAVQDAFPDLTRDWLTTRWKVSLEDLLPELVASEASTSMEKRVNKKKRWHQSPAQPPVKGANINRLTASSHTVQPISADGIHWILDSGAWVHVSNSASVFSSLTSCEYDLSTANASALPVKGTGTVKLICNTSQTVISLTDVHYCPDASSCLISARRLEVSGYRIKWNKDTQPVEVLGPRNTLIASFQRTEGDYIGLFRRPALGKVGIKNASFGLLHQRFGHVNAHAMARLMRCSKPDDFFCDICVRAKAHRAPGKQSISHSSSTLQLVHLDLAGGKQTLPEGLVDSDEGLKSKVRYFLVLTDDFSRYRWIRFAVLKSEVPELIRDFLAHCYTQFGKYPKAIRSDGGREFDNVRVKGFLATVGATWQPTAGYAPEQNGISERSIQTISSMTRAMLTQACVPHKYWPEAATTAVYIINRSPLSLPGRTPHEIMFGDIPHTDHLRVFGCVAYAHEPLALTKLQDRSRAMCLLGYDHSNSWRLLDPSSGRVVRRRDVTFNENMMYFSTAAAVGPDGMSVPYRSMATIRAVRPALTSGPISYKKALAGADADAWRVAMNNEYTALLANEVFEIVPRAEAPTSVLPGLWILRYKDDGTPKARWVIQGQLEGDLPFESTYAQVTHISSMRLVFAHAVFRGFHILQADISTAFLNSELDRTIHMVLPSGFRQEGKVCRLRRAIYGLRTAPKLWKDTFSNALVDLGFTPGAVDSSMFFCGDMLLTVYVDDIIVIGPERPKLLQVLERVAERFALKILGDVNRYLGMRVTYDIEKGSLSLSQDDKIKELASAYNVSLESSSKVPISECDLSGRLLDAMEVTKARSLLGSLLHIATFTRPDIAHSVALIGRHMAAPTSGVMDTLVAILRYLVATISLVIGYHRKANSPALEAFCDANWASLDEPKSTSGHVLFAYGSPVVWKSRRQQLASLSTCEAEYVAATEAVRDIEWFRRIFGEITGAKKLVTISLRMDNMAAIFTALKVGFKARSRHYVVRDQYLRDAVSHGMVVISHIPTSEMIADGFTKCLPPAKHSVFLRQLGLSSST